MQDGSPARGFCMIEKDPYELKNLATETAASSIRKEMEEKLDQSKRRIGDSWELDWTVPVEDGGRLYDYRTFYTVGEYLKWAKAHPSLEPGST